MTEKESLDRVRHVALWATLAAAGVLLILTVLEVWGVISTSDHLTGDTTAWGKLTSTFSAIFGLSLVTLVALLVSSRVKKD